MGSPTLHPGVNIALSRFDMDELHVAKAIIAGELTSPQWYNDNLFLIALRITGTGASYRTAHEEYVWRDPSIYMTPEFLERCQGLPVVFDHPDGSLLNTKEFLDRMVGTIFLPYLKPEVNEVWGIAKILDVKAAELLATDKMSTSPAVLCLGQKLPMKDGKMLLVEDKPHFLDSLAICPLGVWDKGRPAAGVESVDAQSAEEAETLDLFLRNLKIYELSHRYG